MSVIVAAKMCRSPVADAECVSSSFFFFFDLSGLVCSGSGEDGNTDKAFFH